MTAARDRVRIRLYRIILCLAGTVVGLLATLVYLVADRNELDPSGAPQQDSDLRQEVVTQLVAENPGQFDSHADPVVGRIHLPNLRDRDFSGFTASTNRFGLRERDYLVPKPEGVIRIVLLGDSMVYGLGVDAQDRVGVHLEQWLRDRAPDFDGQIECLHLGAVSWNIAAQVAFLRRQLTELDPDLVIQILVPNDIDDVLGARGFGTMASFSVRNRWRADSGIVSGLPQRHLGHATNSRGLARVGYLRLGIDSESQSRYRQAREELQLLEKLTDKAGIRYRVLFHYRHLLPIVWQHIGRHLEPHRPVYLSKRFGTDHSYTISSSDPHWNPDGHRSIAKLLYGLISHDDLLPTVRPSPWEEATLHFIEISQEGRRDAEKLMSTAKVVRRYRAPGISNSIDFDNLDAASAAQIHGGLDSRGLVSPYASFLLRNPRAMRLRVEAQGLPRPELDGDHVQIFADAEFIGDLELLSGTKMDRSFELPPTLADRPFLSIRFIADDYVYQGPDLQHCVSFRLHRIEIE